MGLGNNPSCRKCGAEEETSVQILCECKALAFLRHMDLGSFFLDPEDTRVLGVGAIWNFAWRGSEPIQYSILLPRFARATTRGLQYQLRCWWQVTPL
jgi:hypothetical protein